MFWPSFGRVEEKGPHRLVPVRAEFSPREEEEEEEEEEEDMAI
jgi:hypothetical protein